MMEAWDKGVEGENRKNRMDWGASQGVESTGFVEWLKDEEQCRPLP